MSVFSHNPKDDMRYMHDVDLAMNRSGHPWAFTLTFSVFVFFLVFFVWANFAKIDDVARGTGQIIPEQGIQPVQNEHGGTITDILVSENQMVDVNQIVGTISNVQAVAGHTDLQNRHAELDFSIKRLEAEEKGLPLVFTEEERAAFPDAVDSQLRLYQTRKEQLDGQQQLLLSQLEARRNEVSEAQERKSSLEKQLAVQREQEQTFERLYKTSGSVSRLQVMELQQKVVALEGDLASVVQTVGKAQSGVHAAEERLNNLEAERKATIASEISKARLEQSTIAEQLKASDDQVNRTELRSSIKGTVKRVLLKKGGVAKPGETIMEILPTDGALEVEARFSPQDRGFLYVNQPAIVKVTTYDFSIYGGLEATVVKISNDTIEDKKGEPWYEVRLLTTTNSIQHQGEDMPILPGMTVSVDVLTAKKSVLSLILGPVQRAMQNAMTEH